jgi:nucleotide-binding universal stress UspA family protein
VADNVPEGVAVHPHVLHGTIYDEILRAAGKLEVDLIVIGAHRPEFSDYLLGPNAARVVRHARQSVYVVRT